MNWELQLVETRFCIFLSISTIVWHYVVSAFLFTFSVFQQKSRSSKVIYWQFVLSFANNMLVELELSLLFQLGGFCLINFFLISIQLWLVSCQLPKSSTTASSPDFIVLIESCFCPLRIRCWIDTFSSINSDFAKGFKTLRPYCESSKDVAFRKLPGTGLLHYYSAFY